MQVNFHNPISAPSFHNGPTAGRLTAIGTDDRLAQGNFSPASARGTEKEYGRKSDVSEWANPKHQGDSVDISREAAETQQIDDSFINPLVNGAWGFGEDAKAGVQEARAEAKRQNMMEMVDAIRGR